MIGSKKKETEITMEQFIKSYAKAAIELEKNASLGAIVSIQELKNDGSFLSSALNACGLALILSGIEMKDGLQRDSVFDENW